MTVILVLPPHTVQSVKKVQAFDKVRLCGSSLPSAEDTELSVGGWLLLERGPLL